MGSEFVARIPLLPTSRLPRPKAQFPAAAEDPFPRNHRVLIVDDNEDAAESMALLIRAWYHKVSVVHDATSALDRVGDFNPEAVLVDIGLPDMNGYELAGCSGRPRMAQSCIW